MKRRTLIVAVVVTAVLSVSATVGAVLLFTGPTVAGCQTYRLPDTGGKQSIPVPAFCRNAICELNFDWWGSPIGAFSGGLGFAVQAVQWDDGYWHAGPALSFAGIQASQGIGRNGNGDPEAVVGFYTVPGGETDGYIALWDDLGGENSPLRWTFQFKQAVPNYDIHDVTLYICTD